MIATEGSTASAPEATVFPVAEVVRAAAQGDKEACRTLFRQHYPSVLGFCRLYSHFDADRSQDLAQEVFVRAFRNLGGLREPEKLRGWLLTIAKNVCRAAGVRQSRKRQVEALLALEPTPHETLDGPAEREARIAMIAQLIEAIDHEPTRRIVTLKYTEPEHTTRQIAEKLGIPHGTVCVTLMRFRAKLKADLLKQWEDQS